MTTTNELETRLATTLKASPEYPNGRNARRDARSIISKLNRLAKAAPFEISLEHTVNDITATIEHDHTRSAFEGYFVELTVANGGFVYNHLDGLEFREWLLARTHVYLFMSRDTDTFTLVYKRS